MARVILCIDDSNNIDLWGSITEYGYSKYIPVCIGVDLIGLDCHKLSILKSHITNGSEICSHTTSHFNLNNSSDFRRIKRELVSSKQILSCLFNDECNTIIYPNGGQNHKIRKLAKEVGYKYGRGISPRKFTLPNSFKNTDFMNISSINLPRDISYQKVENAISDWMEMAIYNDWLVCLYAHGKVDFDLDKWKTTIDAIYKFRDKVEVITFKDLGDVK